MCEHACLQQYAISAAQPTGSVTIGSSTKEESSTWHDDASQEIGQGWGVLCPARMSYCHSVISQPTQVSISSCARRAILRIVSLCVLPHVIPLAVVRCAQVHARSRRDPPRPQTKQHPDQRRSRLSPREHYPFSTNDNPKHSLTYCFTCPPYISRPIYYRTNYRIYCLAYCLTYCLACYTAPNTALPHILPPTLPCRTYCPPSHTAASHT